MRVEGVAVAEEFEEVGGVEWAYSGVGKEVLLWRD